MLEKVRQELEYTGEIKDTTTSKGFDISTLQITCKEYKQDLSKYNIIPQKTYTYNFPEKLDKKYWVDFIRGYWDGMEQFVLQEKKQSVLPCVEIEKNSWSLLLTFKEEYNIPKVKVQKKKESNTYYFQYSNNSTIKLFHALYYKKDLLCLDRKEKSWNFYVLMIIYPRDSGSLC